MKLADHPTVRRVRENGDPESRRGHATPLDAGWLKRLARIAAPTTWDLSRSAAPSWTISGPTSSGSFPRPGRWWDSSAG